MSMELVTLSPIDGSELLRRPYVSAADAQAMLARYRAGITEGEDHQAPAHQFQIGVQHFRTESFEHYLPPRA